MSADRPPNWRQALRAREAFVAAAAERGFREELLAFAEAHPPPAFLPADAMAADASYAAALSAFTERWDLPAPWFRAYCHDVAWRVHHEDRQRFYGHPLPRPFAGLELRFDFTPPDAPADRPFTAAAVRPVLWGGALFLDDTKAIARKKVVTAFEAYWDAVIEPWRAKHGGVARKRDRDQTERDARAFVARARLRGEGATPLLSRTVDRLQAAWPDQYAGLQEEALNKALTQFRRLLAFSPEFTAP